MPRAHINDNFEFFLPQRALLIMHCWLHEEQPVLIHVGVKICTMTFYWKYLRPGENIFSRFTASVTSDGVRAESCLYQEIFAFKPMNLHINIQPFSYHFASVVFANYSWRLGLNMIHSCIHCHHLPFGLDLHTISRLVTNKAHSWDFKMHL